MQLAFIDWLAAECRRAPVLLVLDDLQWGDSLSVRLLDGALDNLQNTPFFVLTLGRPEVREVFPNPWRRRRLQETTLPGLTRKASESLAQQVLGAQITPVLIAQIAE